MRDRAVETDVVAEGETAARAAAHRDQPAAGADVDVDAMACAIVPDRLDEDALTARHVSFQSPKAAKTRDTAPSWLKIGAILNEILASATEIKCCIRAPEGKEIALRTRRTADPLMM